MDQKESSSWGFIQSAVTRGDSILCDPLDLLAPFDEITPVARDLRPEQPAPLPNWLAYHRAFLLEQAFGMEALSAVQPGRLRLEPDQLVPVLRAIRMTRVRLLLADGVGLGKTIQAGLLLTEEKVLEDLERSSYDVVVIVPGP